MLKSYNASREVIYLCVITRSDHIHGARRLFWWQISTDFSTCVHRVYSFLHRLIHKRWNSWTIYVYMNFFSSYQLNCHDKNTKTTIIERKHIPTYKMLYYYIILVQINTRTSGSPPTAYRGRKHEVKYDVFITIHRKEAKQWNKNSLQ
jgi:hypothetical protein